MSQLIFTDEAGNRLQSWQVPLQRYAAEYVQLLKEARDRAALEFPAFAALGRVTAVTQRDAAISTHRTVVARARVHKLPVPEQIILEHDGTLLEAAIRQERHFHELGKMYCVTCQTLNSLDDDDVIRGRDEDTGY